MKRVIPTELLPGMVLAQPVIYRQLADFAARGAKARFHDRTAERARRGDRFFDRERSGSRGKGVKTGQLTLLRIPSRIASVPHAVVVLLLNVVKRLTLCAIARDSMKDAGLGQLWRHSLGVAITAQLLGKRLEMKNVEEVFVAGLLHDIGKVILYVKWPDVGKKTKAVNPSGNRPMMQVEQDLYKVSHAEVGGWLANAWHLPATLREPFYTTTNRERHKTPKGECVCNGPAWSRNYREG